MEGAPFPRTTHVIGDSGPVRLPKMAHRARRPPLKDERMKTLTLVAALTLAGTTAFAGGMADPIMEPATTMVASNNPRVGLNEDSCAMQFLFMGKIK